jgi:hypothetical protein
VNELESSWDAVFRMVKLVGNALLAVFSIVKDELSATFVDFLRVKDEDRSAVLLLRIVNELESARLVDF